jgi:penicillin-binding protein 1A
MSYLKPRPISRPALALLVSLALLTVSCAQLTDLPKLSDEDLAGIRLAQSSKIYDGNGALMTTLHGIENRTSIRIGRIPKNLQNAVIATEDERFYEHEGIDAKAILRAFVANVTSGDVREGGSTITQQYVKNTLIAPGDFAAKTLERKIDEAALARQLETKLTKDEILERYLNTVYFGQGAYGVQAAAKTYFGKPAAKLSLPEGAMLAGLIRAPENYDPFDRKKVAKQRRDLVLGQMVRQGYVSQAKADKAMAKKIKLQPRVDKDRYPAPYFVDYVRRLIKYDPRFEDVAETPELREQQMFQGGLRIYTTVDLEAQTAAEEAVASILTTKTDPYGSLVAIDPTTGYIKAMVGGRNFFARKKKDRFAKVNLATVIEPDLDCERNAKTNCKKPFQPAPAPGAGRQAGSAYKAFALTAAIEKGVPLSKTYDGNGPYVIPGADNGADYTVNNYEGSSFGKLTLLDATVNSVNVVYALLGQDIGTDAVVEAAMKMGIRTEPQLDIASAPLGTNPVNPLGMASAYGTLATNGAHVPPIAITKIVGADGKTIFEDESEPEQVVEPPVAYLATTALEQVLIRGTGTNAQIGRPAAGKTGTAQEWRDAWFVGYTPDLVASVWVGYPAGQIEMKTACSVAFIGEREVCRPTRIQVTGGSWPAMIWQAFMLRALSEVPASPFINPGSGLITVTIDNRTYCLAGESTPAEFRAEATFAEGTAPSEECPVEDEGDEPVPDVFGFPVEEAVRIVEGAGFAVVQTQEESTTYPPGFVIGQSPTGGELTTAGSTVTLVVSVTEGSLPSEGGEETSVPSVLGMSRSEAEGTLQAKGFNVNAIIEPETAPGQARRNSGRVWKQSPSSGTSAKRGSTVTIWVNP